MIVVTVKDIHVEKREAWQVIGFDYGLRGLPVPGDAPAPFLEGHKEGRARRESHTLDRFELKWVHLRYGALQRDLIPENGVTPAFLREIDVAYCPVTLVTLSHGTRTDTDWSVDRLNNHGAYATGNLAIMSTKANSAKGDKSFEDVYGLAQGNQNVDGLTPREWYRLAALMGSACTVHRPNTRIFLRLATKLPRHIVRRAELQLQHVMHLAARKRRDERILIRRMRQVWPEQTSTDRLQLLIETVRRYQLSAEYEYDVWLEDKVFERLMSWAQSVPLQMVPRMHALFRELGGGHQLMTSEVRAWHLPTRGRFCGRDGAIQ